jgi:hypothetical protein
MVQVIEYALVDIKTLVGHGEMLMVFADPPGMNPLFTGLCNSNGQHIIKWFDGPLMVNVNGSVGL